MNIPQEKGTEIVRKAYELFQNNPIPTHYLREMQQKPHLSSMETIISKPMGLQWAQEEQCLSQISGWRRLRQT